MCTRFKLWEDVYPKPDSPNVLKMQNWPNSWKYSFLRSIWNPENWYRIVGQFDAVTSVTGCYVIHCKLLMCFCCLSWTVLLFDSHLGLLLPKMPAFQSSQQSPADLLQLCGVKRKAESSVEVDYLCGPSFDVSLWLGVDISHLLDTWHLLADGKQCDHFVLLEFK